MRNVVLPATGIAALPGGSGRSAALPGGHKGLGRKVL